MLPLRIPQIAEFLEDCDSRAPQGTERGSCNSGVDDARATTKTQVRSYFGEKIAFYYLFLAHATTYFSYAAVIGFAVFLNTLISPQAENAASVPYFCAY